MDEIRAYVVFFVLLLMVGWFLHVTGLGQVFSHPCPYTSSSGLCPDIDEDDFSYEPKRGDGLWAS